MIPDWLVERVALGEVPAAFRARVAAIDAQTLADRVAALRAETAAELATHPIGPAIAQINERVAGERKMRSRAQGLAGVLGALASAAALVVIVLFFVRSGSPGEVPPDADTDGIRIKGGARLLAFRQVGAHVEQLEEDMLVRYGDVLQLRYNGGGKRHGVIASIDGAGAVTLHFPATEDTATALAAGTTNLPSSYALDDAPRFERFFFLTADAPIDVKRVIAVLGAFARRGDSATATPDLPTGLHSWSLRLRKPDRSSTP